MLNRPFLFLLIVFIGFGDALLGQQIDSVKPVRTDSVVTINKPIIAEPDTDTLHRDTTGVKDTLNLFQNDSTSNSIDSSSAAENTTRNKIEKEKRFSLSLKNFDGDEFLFYALIAMLVFYATLRMLFPKYFKDLFRVYFRTTLNQTQIREQLLQSPLPSLFLNGFFVITGGLYATFLLFYFKIASQFRFWELWLYCSFLLSIIYMMKFAGVKLAGWLFNKNEAAISYIFIVFMTNKILGIIVLPFLVLLAYGSAKIYLASVFISISAVSCILLYRTYLSIGVIRNQIRINPLHFFLYLFAFELTPLLVLFKLVMNFLK